jgi:hypothetical protein
MVAGPNIPGIATHSKGVELCLAFGIPIEGLFFPVLLVTFIEVARHAYPARMTVLGLLCCLLVGTQLVSLQFRLVLRSFSTCWP